MTHKLVIADDEPLVLVGLQSMLDWASFGISIAGLARNGAQLMELIESESPDIVITDIRMPVKSGLEVMRECGVRFGRLPLFIILTSHEEYSYVKESISCQAVNYLVKIELTKETLSQAVTRALDILQGINRLGGGDSSPSGSGMQPFLDRFFVRLLSGLIESRAQYLSQMEELGLDAAPAPCRACYCEISGLDASRIPKEKVPELYSGVVGIVREAAVQQLGGFVVSLDLRFFCVIFREEGAGKMRETLLHAVSLVRDYFAFSLRCSVGKSVDDLYSIRESFATARMIHSRGIFADGVAVYDQLADSAVEVPEFDLGFYRGDLVRSFQELDFAALADVLDRVRSCLAGSGEPVCASHAQAMDAACSVLYMALSLLPDGEEIVSGIFEGVSGGYRSIYECKSARECLEWIVTLRNGLVGELQSRRQDYRMRIVSRIQRYVEENVCKRLTLGEVASLYGFSQNYLSTLFTKYGGCSFVEFTTNTKIAAAKKMMASGDLKINEIAERLGFESAFYFSKVFKKVEGISPRDYMRQGERDGS